MKGAILHCIRVVDVVNADSHTLCATVLRSEHIFNIFDLEDAHSVVGDGRTLCVLVAHCLTCKQGSEVNWVSREGEVFFIGYHKGNITQGWVRVKGDYTKAIKKVMIAGMVRIMAVPQKVNTSTFFSNKIEVTHMISTPLTMKGRITENKEGIG